ncbi:DUF4922 domain-containing protein [Neptuniibacter caesariensis]|uniref:Ap-4-A phosphorylase II n=1 Tax=Neptuniibacter caesariensis TaxID=207954 RepID=A0A7U8GTJ4_NEPCE|nr:DUF4922 domain-containing protein [Neptuniibacter caesariensis]EAR62362.1 Ap-4-A phosphorylase II [Oceanospirillum sp. MED92] [Neptuniibacter caesariensis]
MDSSLWSRAEAIADSAKKLGSLQSLETLSENLQEGNLCFTLRQISSLRRKKNNSERSDKPRNPFFPYEAPLFVDNAGPAHNILLNKFNVLEQHLLITTKVFEPQTSELSLADFHALYECMKQDKALAFYNSGPEAGASQQHKHLQLVKTAPAAQDIPFAAIFEQLRDEVPRKLADLPFEHVALGLNNNLFDSEWFTPADAAAQLKNLYDRLRASLSIESTAGHIEQPYNWLLTQEWMLLVPRRKESYQGVSLNALAFIGSILVPDKKQARQIKSAGLARALTEVSGLI